MSGSPSGNRTGDHDDADYRVSDPAALEAEVERQKEQDRESAREWVARETEQQRKRAAEVEPEAVQVRRKRAIEALDAPTRQRKAEQHYEQNREIIEDSLQRLDDSFARTMASRGGSPRTDKPSAKPRKRRRRSIAEFEETLLSATTATEVLTALGRLLLARARRPYATNLVPTPAELHAVRGQLPEDVAANINTDGLISFAVEEARLGLYEQTIVQVHAQWKWATRNGRQQQHPLESLVAWWQETHGSPPSKVPTVVLQHGGHDHLRTPGLMTTALLSPLIVVEIDGQPFGSTAPVQMMRRLPAPAAATAWEQLELLPGPRTLDDAAVDPVLAAVSRIDCTDRRSPLRSDVLLLVRLGCAIAAPVELDIDGWARVLRGSLGRVQPGARLRAQKALTTGAVIVWFNNRPYQMIRAITGLNGNLIMHPSAGAGWWRGGRGGGDAWRLSGGLCRTLWTGAKQGGHRRMAEGIEAALSWTPPERNGIPKALLPISDRPGSPGHEYYIGWRRVVFLGGEPYPLGNDETASRVYRKRVADFEKAGYRAKGNTPAPAGDTWEITHRVRGGIFVRTSARQIEAVRLAQNQNNFTVVTLDKVLLPEPAAA